MTKTEFPLILSFGLPLSFHFIFAPSFTCRLLLHLLFYCMAHFWSSSSSGLACLWLYHRANNKIHSSEVIKPEICHFRDDTCPMERMCPCACRSKQLYRKWRLRDKSEIYIYIKNSLLNLRKWVIFFAFLKTKIPFNWSSSLFNKTWYRIGERNCLVLLRISWSWVESPWKVWDVFKIFKN